MNTLEYLISNKANIDLMELYRVNEIKYLYESNKIPLSLYKYSGINQYSINNILKNELTITNPGEFNDPYDSTIHIDSNRKTFSEALELNKLAEELDLGTLFTNEMLEDKKKFSKDRDFFMLNYLTDDSYVNSLSTNNKSILMWSHYANNNQGICVEYDFTSSTTNSELKNVIYPVVYLDNPLD